MLFKKYVVMFLRTIYTAHLVQKAPWVTLIEYRIFAILCTGMTWRMNDRNILLFPAFINLQIAP